MTKIIFIGVFFLCFFLVRAQEQDTLLTQYEKTERIGDSLYAVYKSDKCALYNANQKKFKTGFEYAFIDSFFDNGLAECGIRLKNESIRGGLINAEGTLLTGENDYYNFEELWVGMQNREVIFLPTPEQEKQDQKHSLLYLKFEDGNKPYGKPSTGLMNQLGQVIIPPIYHDIWNENYGMVGVLVSRKNTYLGIYDAITGAEIVPVRLTEEQYEKTINLEILRYQEDKKFAPYLIDTIYYRNGQVSEIRSWKAGKLNGTTYGFDEFGQLIYTIDYADGNVINSSATVKPRIVFPGAEFNASALVLSNDERFILTLPNEIGNYFYLIETKSGKIIRKIPAQYKFLHDLKNYHVQLNDSTLVIAYYPNEYEIMSLQTGEVSFHKVANLPFYPEDVEVQMSPQNYLNGEWLSFITFYRDNKDNFFLDIFSKNVYSQDTLNILGINITQHKNLIQSINDVGHLSFQFFPQYTTLIYLDSYENLVVFDVKKRKLIQTFSKNLNGNLTFEAPNYSAVTTTDGIVLLSVEETRPDSIYAHISYYDFKLKTEFAVGQLSREKYFWVNSSVPFVSNDGKQIFLYHESESAIMLIDLEKKTLVFKSLGQDKFVDHAYSFYTHTLHSLTKDDFLLSQNLTKPNDDLRNYLSTFTSVLFNEFYTDEGFLVFNSLSSDSSASAMSTFYFDLTNGDFEKSQFTNAELAFQMYVNDSLFYKELAFDGAKRVYLMSAFENKFIYGYTNDKIHHDLAFYNRNKVNFTERHVHLKLMNDNDFILFAPDGYYMCSKGVSDLIYFEVGLNLYSFEQFDLKYNRPDIILDRLGYADRSLIAAYHQAYLKRLKKMGFTEEMLQDDFHLPEIKIENLEEIPSIDDDGKLDLKLKLFDTKYPLDRINVWVNDVAIYGKDGISLRDKNVQEYSTSLSVALAKGKNKIQVSVLNQAGAESYKETIEVNCTHGKDQSDLYILTVGVSNYNDSRYNLSYAAKDANDLVTTFRTNKFFENVYSKTLTDNQVTLENISNLKSFFANADINDQVIIFIAGHGVLDAHFDYYFASYDMDFANPSARGIPYELIESLLDGIKPLKKLLFMDTCHSGEVDKDEIQVSDKNNESESDVVFRNVGVAVENKESHLGLQNTSELTKSLFTDLRKGTGATVISSAGGVEFAMESDQWKNGLFTYCLIQGLTTKAADYNNDKTITVSEIQSYVQQQVTKLSNGKQTPTSRIENQTLDYRVW